MIQNRNTTRSADVAELVRRLSAVGLSAEAAAAKAAMFAQVVEALAALEQRERLGAGTAKCQPPSPPTPLPEGEGSCRPLAVFVPGRIEVLGKHTDYAGGQSLTVAAEHGFCMAARPRDDHWLTVVDISSGEHVHFPMVPDIEPPVGLWANYPMTVARRLARNFPGIRRGADIAFASDLPRAAGMSSSSAFMVSVFLLLSEINRLPERQEYQQSILGRSDLAAYLATIENGRSFGPLAGDLGVGTLGGSEDQTALLCSEPRQIGQYSYCPVMLEKRLPVPADCVFAVGVSGVVAEKTGAAREQYNTASRLASALLDVWRTATGGAELTLAAALHSSPGAADRLKGLLQTHCPPGFAAAALATRLEHFLVENDEVIPQAGAALAANDRATFGQCVDRSQVAAEQLLGNQIPQTVFLAAEARRQGATAASAFGAGFGGSVWALIERDRAAQFLPAWAAKYQATFPAEADAAQFFLTSAGPAAFRVELE